MPHNPNAPYKFYQYDPSMAAAALFLALFSLTTVLHLYQLLATRTWYTIPLVIGGIFEITGYIGRAIASEQTPNWTLGPFIVSTLTLLLAPALFAASLYMELGRIIRAIDGERQCVIRLRWLTKTFVTGDVLSFLVQSAGGGIMGSNNGKSMTLGSNLVVGGLVIQLLFFGLFLIVTAMFDRNIRKTPTSKSRTPTVDWYKHLVALYAASILILIRSVFRVVEYVQGNDGYLLGHEYFLYIFDAVLMLGLMISLNIIHPSEINAILRGGKFSMGAFKLSSMEGPRV